MPKAIPDGVLDIHQTLGPAEEFDLVDIPPDGAFAGWLAPATPGVLRALAPPVFYNTGDGIAGVRRLNDLVRLAAAGDPSTVAVFAVVEPQHGDAALRELDRVADAGFSGVALSPRAQGVFADAPPVVEIVAHAARRGLLTTLHATPASGNEALWRLWNLAGLCEGAPLIALGALRSWDSIQAIVSSVNRAANIHYDCAGLADPRALLELARVLGPERLLFGSGARGGGSAALVERAIRQLSSADLPDGLRDSLMRGNAVRLLRLASGAGQ